MVNNHCRYLNIEISLYNYSLVGRTGPILRIFKIVFRAVGRLEIEISKLIWNFIEITQYEFSPN